MHSLAKIFCVAKDETDLMESWISYHGSLVGLENLVIVDNMSSCEKVLAVYDKYRTQGVTVEICQSFAGQAQGAAFTASMRKHQKCCKFLIGIDADEFLAFPDFLAGKRGLDLKSKLQKYLLGLPEDTTKFSILTYFEAVPDPTCMFYVDQKIQNPVRNISTFAWRAAQPSKCFFRADAFVRTANGCHSGRVSRGKTRPSDLCVIHYHSTGARRSIERARAIISAYRYANVDAPLDLQLRQLQQVESPFGSHRVLEYGVFLSKVLVLRALVQKQLWPVSQKVLVSKARRFHTINGVGVDSTNCCSLPVDWENKFDFLIFSDPEVKDAMSTKPLLAPETQKTRPPRVAIMLSGHFRNFGKRKPFWQRFLAEHKDRQIDIFVHTWAETGEKIDVDDVRNTIKPVAMQVETHEKKVEHFSLQQEGLDLFHVEFPGLEKADDFSEHVMSQLYSVHQAFLLVEAHEKTQGTKYDLLVRLRADSIVENFSRIFSSNLEFARDDVLVVNGSSVHQHTGGGGGCGSCDKQNGDARRHVEHTNDICDVFYWGRFSPMKRASELFLHARDLVKSFKFSNAVAVTEPDVKRSLVHHKNVIGVKGGAVYENKIKCFHPERLLREHMVSQWIISDPLRTIRARS